VFLCHCNAKQSRFLYKIPLNPRISSKMATIDECIEFPLKNIATNENILLLDEYSKVKLC
jgi:hypothetical protein